MQRLHDDGQRLARAEQRLVVHVVVAVVGDLLVAAEGRVDPLQPRRARGQHLGPQVDGRGEGARGVDWRRNGCGCDCGVREIWLSLSGGWLVLVLMVLFVIMLQRVVDVLKVW